MTHQITRGGAGNSTQAKILTSTDPTRLKRHAWEIFLFRGDGYVWESKRQEKDERYRYRLEMLFYKQRSMANNARRGWPEASGENREEREYILIVQAHEVLDNFMRGRLWTRRFASLGSGWTELIFSRALLTASCRCFARCSLNDAFLSDIYSTLRLLLSQFDLYLLDSVSAP